MRAGYSFSFFIIHFTQVAVLRSKLALKLVRILFGLIVVSGFCLCFLSSLFWTVRELRAELQLL